PRRVHDGGNAAVLSQVFAVVGAEPLVVVPVDVELPVERPQSQQRKQQQERGDQPAPPLRSKMLRGGGQRGLDGRTPHGSSASSMWTRLSQRTGDCIRAREGSGGRTWQSFAVRRLARARCDSCRLTAPQAQGI